MASVAERQHWRKLGLIYCPDGSNTLMRSHTALPFADPIGGGLFRIYFSSRDAQQRSRTFSLVIDLQQPERILDLRVKPILDLGALGGFDDSGAMLTWITPHDDGTHLFYFVGWNLRVTIPFHNALGVALVENGAVTTRFRGPVIDRILEEPYFVGSACILKEGDCFRCWYLSCTGWHHASGGLRHRYHLKYAESPDGLHWRRAGVVAVDFADPQEYAISRPSVIRDPGGFRMWFSCRGNQYRIGYAESPDGIQWQRDDAAVGLALSESGWDSMALSYPHVFRHGTSLFMLYNGNEYGRTGFGLAMLE
jgi:hypothetical protein